MQWTSEHKVFAVERGDVEWPARSPDLSPCDFFLWGHLKADVFKSRPRTIPDLKEAIIKAVSDIPPQMVAETMKNFRERLKEYVAGAGGHLKNVIF